MKTGKKLLCGGLAFLLMASWMLGCSAKGESGGDALPPQEEPAAEERLPAAEDLPRLAEMLEEDQRVWRYTDDPVRLAEITDDSWTQADFDDSGWLEGAGAFGAKDGRLRELDDDYEPDVCLRQYLPDGNNIPAFYFRLRFTAEEADRQGELGMRVAYDDAVIVYLNGEQVFSANVPEGGYDRPNAYGSTDVRGALGDAAFQVDGTLLRKGENVLAVELHQDDETSSDIFFRMPELASEAMVLTALREDTLCLGAGADASQMLVTWQGQSGGGSVELAPWSQSPDWAGATVVQAQAVYEQSDGTCTYRAVLDGLEPGEYAYRVTDSAPSALHRFAVEEEQDGFSFLCNGDAQLGDDDDREPMEIYEGLAAWAMGDQTPAFVLSLGDQSDDEDEPDLFRRFVSTPLLKTVPLAAVVGNHEDESEQFSRFFFLPNMDEATVDAAGDMSGDYWFFRGGVLFLCMNSSNSDADGHGQFLRQAVEDCRERYGEPRWTVAALHYSLFSAGDHAADDSILRRREEYTEVFDEIGVDVVFAGHDHTFARSWPIDGTEPVIGGAPEDGIVYFTLTSSTGTKFYELYGEELDYVAVCDGSERPCMSRVDVTDETMTVTTYCEDGGQYEVLDEYVIR